MVETKIAEPQSILKFWEDAGPQMWWKKDAAFDAEISNRFGTTYEAACAGELDEWEKDPKSALALILLLDQFSRNLHRDSPLAFAQDEKCVALVHRMMTRGDDRKLDLPLAQFIYLPLMHSEKMQDQDICLKELTRLDLPLNVKAAVEHRDIIRDFGRFPHRNRVLGRETTPEEQAFLDDGGFKG